MMKRLMIWGIPLVLFLGFAALLFSRLGENPSELPSARIGKPFPAFSLPSLLDDRPLTVADLQGKPLVLNVWASWCPSCAEEQPALMALSRTGLPIVGLNYKDAPEDARQWLANRGNPYAAIISDQKGSLGLDLGVYGAPETYLLDAQARVRFRYVGAFDGQVWTTRLKPCYEQLLKGGEAPACTGS